MVHYPDRSPFLQGNQGRNSCRQSHLPHSEEQRRRDPSLSATQLAFSTLRESRMLATKRCHPHSGSSCISQLSRQTPTDSPTGQPSLGNSSLGLSSQHSAEVGVNSRSGWSSDEAQASQGDTLRSCPQDRSAFSGESSRHQVDDNSQPAH